LEKVFVQVCNSQGSRIFTAKTVLVLRLTQQVVYANPSVLRTELFQIFWQECSYWYRPVIDGNFAIRLKVCTTSRIF